MIIDHLLCIYNYIPVSEPSYLKVKFELVQNYPPIQKILRHLFSEKHQEYQSFEDAYYLLNECKNLFKQVITKQEQTLGPKRFRKLIQNVFTIMTQYIINLLRSKQNSIQQAFFHLTYYKKNCGKYIDDFYSCCILIFYIICNFKMNQINSIDEKIQECRLLVKNILEQKQLSKQALIIQRLCCLFQSFLWHQQKQVKKAKDLCSKIISSASIQLSEYIKVKRSPPPIIKVELLLSYLTVSQIYKDIGKYQLHLFLLNKCIQYSEKYLQNNSQFLKFLNVDKMEPKPMKIKLTRLQEKIRRVDLIRQEVIKKEQDKKFRQSKNILKSGNKLQYNQKFKFQLKIQQNLNKLQIKNKLMIPKQKNEKKNSSTFHYATLRTNSQISFSNNFLKQKQNQEINKIAIERQSQLENILIIKDKKKNYFRLKQQTLKYLNKQNLQLKRLIKSKSREIDQIGKVKNIIRNKFDVKELNKQIGKFENYECKLISQIQGKKWKYLDQLPAVKKIGLYMKTFFQLKYYWHVKNVYSLVYGEMLNRSQMKMISVIRRKVHKTNKEVITQVSYNNIRHQVQFIKQSKQNNQFIYFINIYQTQKGNGINQQLQISQDQYKLVKYQPFYNFYSWYQGELITFEQHVASLSLKQLYYVKKFINKLNYLNPLVGKKTFKKICYAFNYDKKTQKSISNDKQTLSNDKQMINSDTKFMSTSNKNASNEKKQPGFIIQAIFFVIIQQQPVVKHVHLFKQVQQKQLSESSVSIEQQQNKQYLSIIIEKVSNNKYHNKNYNFSLNTRFSIYQSLHSVNYSQIIKNTLIDRFNHVFSKFNTQILLIQTNIRRKLAQNSLKILKQSNHVETYNLKNFVYTLLINNQTQQSIFTIQKVVNDKKNNFAKSYQMFIKKQVTFKTLQFLPKIQSKLLQTDTLEQHYWKIEKYLKIKHFATKIFFKSKHIRFFTDFQTQFKKKLCFAVIQNQFLFRGKMREGKIMYMLTVKEFSKIPRPYLLRIFTLNSNSIISIDAQKTIYNKQKIFLQSKLSTINEVIQILSKNQFQIFAKIKAQPIKKVSSRISILSNYSFQSGDSSKDNAQQKSHGSNVLNRRMSKNSMFAKFRHKALIKNQDLQAIKKMVQQKKFEKQQSSSNSGSSLNSIASPVISANSSEDRSSTIS